jgi:hypothetical protein
MGLGAEFGPSAAIQKPHDMGQFGQFDKVRAAIALITRRAAAASQP